MIHSYIAADIETTGLNVKKEKIIEIGALLVEEGEVREEFHTLIHPHREISEKTVQLTGITNSMVEDAPGIEEVIGKVTEFCRDLPLLGHQIFFDYCFLKRAAVNNGYRWEKEGIDTLKLCRIFMPPEEKKDLSHACQFFGLDRGICHRALPDAYAAHHLYQALMKTYGRGNEEQFQTRKFIYRIKKEQPASKRQKERLQELLKYHKIEASVQIEHLTRNEASRMTDEIMLNYGRIGSRGEKKECIL